VGQWGKNERKFIIWFLFGIVFFLFLFFVLIPQITKTRFVPLPLYETFGITVDSGFTFTLSPDNRWILYFEKKYPYNEKYNLVAFDTLNKKKFILENKEVTTEQLKWVMEYNCWSKDSLYCVLPVGQSAQNPSILERIKIVPTPPESPWLLGSQLTESRITNPKGIVGYINNGPDVFIDFTNSELPILKTQFFDYSLVDPSHPELTPQTGKSRLTFDTLSPDGFTCSDCSVLRDQIQSPFGNNNDNDYTPASPDGRYKIIKYQGAGFGVSSGIYIKDVNKGNKIFITSNRNSRA